MLKRLLWLSVACVGILVVLVALAHQKDVPTETLLSKYARPPSQFITIDGMSVHYRDTGKGRPVLLLHGNTSSLHTWDGWADALDDEYRVVRLDLPGFGLTGPHPEGRYEITYIVDFLSRFMAKLGISKPAIAGNSHGGFVAWMYAALHPGNVDRLCLIDSAGYPLQYTFWAFAVRDFTIFKMLYPLFTPRWATGLALRATYGDPSRMTEEVIDRYYDLHLRSGNRQAGIDMMPIYKVKNADLIKSIKTPTQIMWGDKDLIIGVEKAELFARDIEGSKLVIYKGIGHMPMEEIPTETAADFRHFLADSP